MKKIAILQSNYIPWKGYFDMINMVDEFVLYDTEQYTRRDWRNRNKIKTANGLQWLTIPVQVKGNYYQKINETKVSDQKWRLKHWKSIENSYKKTKYFEKFEADLKPIYLESDEEFLSKINFTFITKICEILNIRTKLVWASEFEISGEKTEKLLNICKQANATSYLSGPSAKNYLDEDLFMKNGIEVKWMDYSGYLEYSQLYPPFEHGVSIIDLLFNEGKNTTILMKSIK